MSSYSANPQRYEIATYRRCGNSGLKLPPVSLGLWQNFGDSDPLARQREIILSAFDSGVTHFDLANNYGPSPGSAEINFGQVMESDLRPYRDELVISTKAGYHMWNGPYGEWGSRKYLVSSLDQSLRRMKLDYVDIFYHHRPDPDTPLEETMAALDHLVRQGKALYVGISNYSGEQTLKAAAILKSLGTPLLIHQPKYNMFHRVIEPDLIPVLEKENVGCIPFSPLAQGLLTDRYLNGIPSDSRAGGKSVFLKKDHITPEILTKVTRLHDLAHKRGQSLAQMALAWILRIPQITSVLIGASSVSQLQQNLDCIKVSSFSAEELKRIDEILG